MLPQGAGPGSGVAPAWPSRALSPQTRRTTHPCQWQIRSTGACQPRAFSGTGPVEAQIKMHQDSLQRKQHFPTPPETDVASFDSAPTSGAGTPVLSHRPPPLSQTIDDEKLTAAMFPPAYGITAPLAPVPPLSYCPLPPDLDRPMEPPKVKPPHQPQTQHPPSQSQAHGANSLFYTENAHPMYHAGGTVSDAVLMPSPPSRSSGDRESIRESLTVDDLEKDFAQIRAQRNYQKGLLARLNQQDLDRQRHQDLLLRQHQLNERREQQFHERSMASPENRFAGQEQFPYALGARGPSAKSVPSINPIPVGQAGSSVRLSSNNMEYIVSALNDSDEVQQDKLDSSDDRQKQFMNEQKHRVGMAASTAGDEVVDLGVHRRSVTSVGSEYSFRRSGISAMSGLSDMSLSLSNMNIQGLNGGISSIKEGKKEDLSEADLEGSGTLYGEESTQMEPRCISNIRTNPDMHLFGSSSLSLMKGLNGDSSSTFSGLSAVMNAFSGCDEETRIESLSSSGSSKSKSLSRN